MPAAPLPAPYVRPEILAPAGGWDCARAAVECGADAIYFGLAGFNARARANNFEASELSELMAFLHGRGVKGYATFNVLIFQDEWAKAEEALRQAIAAGVDALIVQDVGACRLIRKISPDMPIHASTQMTATSAAGVEFARELGAELVVLARENSLAEIERMRKELADHGTAIPLEVFVHGALCVAYSGQCLTSESFGGRSANRGECAQACRLPYELLVDGEPMELGERKYLLSPQDLAGLEMVPELMRAGVSSLKIEGRLKTPQYVAAITRAYRATVDAVATALAEGKSFEEAKAIANGLRHDETYALDMSFSRGLSTGWLGGIDNQKLVHARFGKKRGAKVGRVASVEQGRGGVWLVLAEDAHLKPGDGVVFDLGAEGDTEQEAGGFVHTVEGEAPRLFVRFDAERMDWPRVKPGALVWKTKDPAFEKATDALWQGADPHATRPLFFRVAASAGAPLRIEVRDEQGRTAAMSADGPLQVATKRPAEEGAIREQLARLGGTPFHLGGLEVKSEGGPLVPASVLNGLRRELVQKMLERRSLPNRWIILPPEQPEPQPAPEPPGEPELIPLIRHLRQAQAVLESGARTVYFDPENPKDFRAVAEQVKAFRAEAGSGVELWLAPPRIFKPGEDWMLKLADKAGADGILARNFEHLRAFAGRHRLRGDFSLNVANAESAAEFLGRGLERVTASYDLAWPQLEALAKAMDPARLEVTLHQHMPMFHMEHCVFCTFLSKGHDYRDCGLPCEKHEVRLRDRTGAEHLLRADAGCRNTLHNAKAQTGAEYAERMLAAGLRRFRIEFLDEDAAEIARALERYRRLLRGEISGRALWQELKLENRLGVTRGTLQVIQPGA